MVVLRLGIEELQTTARKTASAAAGCESVGADLLVERGRGSGPLADNVTARCEVDCLLMRLFHLNQRST
jgi:hypothetical protein